MEGNGNTVVESVPKANELVMSMLEGYGLVKSNLCSRLIGWVPKVVAPLTLH